MKLVFNALAISFGVAAGQHWGEKMFLLFSLAAVVACVGSAICGYRSLTKQERPLS